MNPFEVIDALSYPAFLAVIVAIVARVAVKG